MTDPVRSGRAPARLRPALWLAAALAALLLPLSVLLPGPTSPPRGFGWDFAMALGYAALVMFGLQFALTARFRRVTAPFGIDLVYYFHRYLAIGALLVVAAHAAIVDGLQQAPQPQAHVLAGIGALAVFLCITGLSLARKRLRLDYDRWRALHALLAASGVSLALWHLFGAAHYLDRPWKWLLWLGCAMLWLSLVVYVRLLRPWLVSRRPYRVAALRQEHGRVWTVTLAPTRAPTLSFMPGQFAWLTLRGSAFAMHDHPFSIASSASHPQAIELSIKELGDFTATIKTLRVGELAFLDAPYGAFSIDRLGGADAFLFVAGGIGIAPLLSMLRTMADRGDRRPIVLLYGNRVWERVAFREELQALQQRLALQVVHVLLEPPPDWDGERGFIDTDLLRRHLPRLSPGLHCFVCGPVAMTQAVELGLGELRFPLSQVHSEMFDWV